MGETGPRTLRDVFLMTREHSDRDAIVFLDERITYADQWDSCVAAAHALDAAGVGSGDRVAIILRNYPEWIMAFWAIQLVGATAVPVNAWMKRHELATILELAEPAVIFADPERWTVMDELDLTGFGVRLAVGVRSREPVDTVVDFADFIAPYRGQEAPPERTIAPTDIATIMFTSGTSGTPKGVLGTHWNHVVGLLGKLARAPRPDASSGKSIADVTKLVTFPMFHVAGLNTMLTAATAGQRAVLMYKWDPHEALRLIEEEQVAEMAGPPLVVRTLLDAAADTDRDLSSLVSLGTGGSSTPGKVATEIDRLFGGRVSPRTGYGMTETTTGVAAIWGPDFLARPTSVGRPLNGVEISILDEGGQAVRPGEVGEIAVRGAQVSPGYFRDDSTTRGEGEYFRTGDQGRYDEDGFLYVVGRLKDIVIRASENINCAEVEACLHSHPDVLEVAVFGIPHPVLGEELCAIVRLRAGASTSIEELRSFAAGRLSAFKVPARWAVVSEPLPRNPAGKLVKAGIIEVLHLESRFIPASPANA